MSLNFQTHVDSCMPAAHKQLSIQNDFYFKISSIFYHFITKPYSTSSCVISSNIQMNRHHKQTLNSQGVKYSLDKPYILGNILTLWKLLRGHLAYLNNK